jgi:exoribonuclease-2
MNVFYEEDGDFKVGRVLAQSDFALQVESAQGRRSKVKASSVLVRFEMPPIAEFLDAAKQEADRIDVDFLWQCCGTDEFAFDALGREYFGRPPAAPEAAALLLKLHGAPMYFYKKGKGRYRAAPPEALKAALAGMEKKRLQGEQKARYVEALRAGRLPEEFQPQIARLLYAPDKNSLEWKALDAACDELKITPPRMLERCGALASPYEYHLNRFLFEHFPEGTGFPELPAPRARDALPLADVAAFSIDDITTTEIDDALSVTSLPNGNVDIGIHIAAPALDAEPGSEIDAVARNRLSTVYFPGEKITMLPGQVIDAFTLRAGTARAALSLYAEVDSEGAVVATRSRCEQVPIADNLRHSALEERFNAETLAAGAVDHEHGVALERLWRFALRQEAGRGKAEEPGERRPEYSFYVESDRVRIVERKRGAPLDKVVSELMIFANTEWGRMLAEAGWAAIFRAQTGGATRMTTAPAAHIGLGVAQYAWTTSPLRRYVDLVNQRQLIALLAGRPAPYQSGDEALLAAVRDFEVAYEAYDEFQHGMERYWSLRWILQEKMESITGVVIRESLVRLDGVPLVVRVPTVRDVVSGDRVRLGVTHVDLWELALHAKFECKVSAS